MYIYLERSRNILQIAPKSLMKLRVRGIIAFPQFSVREQLDYFANNNPSTIVCTIMSFCQNIIKILLLCQFFYEECFYSLVQ